MYKQVRSLRWSIDPVGHQINTSICITMRCMHLKINSQYIKISSIKKWSISCYMISYPLQILISEIWFHVFSCLCCIHTSGTGALAIFLRKSYNLDITTSDYDDQEIMENIAHNCGANDLPVIPHIKREYSFKSPSHLLLLKHRDVNCHFSNQTWNKYFCSVHNNIFLQIKQTLQVLYDDMFVNLEGWALKLF